MSEDLSKFLAAQPVHQRVVINLTTRNVYPQAVWELIGHHITNLLLESEHITVPDNIEAKAEFKRVGRRLWSFEIEFEIMNTCSLFELEEVKNALYAFLLQVGAKGIGSTFERVD